MPAWWFIHHVMSPLYSSRTFKSNLSLNSLLVFIKFTSCRVTAHNIILFSPTFPGIIDKGVNMNRLWYCDTPCQFKWFSNKNKLCIILDMYLWLYLVIFELSYIVFSNCQQVEQKSANWLTCSKYFRIRQCLSELHCICCKYWIFDFNCEILSCSQM